MVEYAGFSHNDLSSPTVCEFNAGPVRYVPMKIKEHETQLNVDDQKPTALIFPTIYFPCGLIKQITDTSNHYARYCLPALQFSELYSQDICHFFEAYFYMGICDIPTKTDYWSTHEPTPQHPALKCLRNKRFK